eukprot:6260730-Amphidinium_carterae.1
MQLSLRLFVQLLERKYNDNMEAAWAWLDYRHALGPTNQKPSEKDCLKFTITEEEWGAKMRGPDARYFGPSRPLYLMLDSVKQGISLSLSRATSGSDLCAHDMYLLVGVVRVGASFKVLSSVEATSPLRASP